jgi:hypothetical protein
MKIANALEILIGMVLDCWIINEKFGTKWICSRLIKPLVPFL